MPDEKKQDLPFRLMAFKSGGMYYVFNSSKTSLISIPFREESPDYTLWEDVNDLNSLNSDQCDLISGKDLLIHTSIEDDSYKLSLKTYDVIQTTETSNFMLQGYGGINSIAIDGSTTSKMLLSFDERKTWYRYDATKKEWIKTKLKDIYPLGNTVAQVKTYNRDIFKKIFRKNCTLDYAITLTPEETLTSVTLNLPANSAPQILKLNVTANETTHKSNVAVYAEVDDPEGDDITYKVTRKIGSRPEVELESGAVSQFSQGKLNYVFDTTDWEIGKNILKFTYTDEKKASSSGTVTINKVNENMTILANFNKGKLSYFIDDKDHDSGKVKIELNGEVLQDYTSNYIPTPIDEEFVLPPEKIKFGVNNVLKIYYKEDIYDTKEKSTTINFEGKYWGLLFVDLSNSDPGTNGKPNQLHYFSTSLGELIKALEIPPVYYKRQSRTYEVGIMNTSDTEFSEVTIYPVIVNNSYAVRVSDKSYFDLNQDYVKFTEVKPDEEKPRRFYVKVVSYDETDAVIDEDVTAVATLVKKKKQPRREDSAGNDAKTNS